MHPFSRASSFRVCFFSDAHLTAIQLDSQCRQRFDHGNIGAERFTDFSRKRQILIIKIRAGIEGHLVAVELITGFPAFEDMRPSEFSA